MFAKLKRFGSALLDTFEYVMTIVGIYLIICSIRDLWSEELRRRYSIKTRLGILAFYLVHITALVLATGLIGEYLLSASMATLLVNMTSIINDVYDYLQEIYFNFQRKRKLRKLEQDFPIHNVNFQQNNLFLKEFVDLRDEIEKLSAQQHELVILSSQLDVDSVSSIHTQVFQEQLSQIAKLIKSKCEFIVAEQILVDRYYQKHGFEIDEHTVIRETSAEIQVINEHRKQLNLVIQDLKSQGPQDSDDINFYQSQLLSLDNTTKKRAIINQHFYKLCKAKEALVDVNDQLSKLDEKYQNAPFNTYEPTESEQIKRLEKNYLLERSASLQNFIDNPIHVSEGKLNKDEIWVNAQSTLEKLENVPDQEDLKSILSSQINMLELMLVDASNKFDKKKEFIQAITANPKKDIKQDFDKIYRTGKEIIEIKEQIKLASLEEKHKLMSTSISILSACTVFLISYFSYRIDTLIFEGFNRALSIFGAVASIWGRQENLRAEVTSEEVQEIEIQKLNEECAARAQIVPDTALQSDCVSLMQRMSQRLDERYPLRRTAMPSESSNGKAYLPRTTLPRSPYKVTSEAPTEHTTESVDTIPAPRRSTRNRHPTVRY